MSNSISSPSGFNFNYLKEDISSGLVVFFVALPLCLGIALASGAPLFSGLIAGIVGGTIVAMASGSSLSVSGPAAGLTVIVLSSIEELGGFGPFLLAVVLAGAIQLILGFAKAGIIAYYFPSNVIKGMLAAIGIILILKQIPHAVGYDADTEGDEGFSQADGENTFSALFSAMDVLHPGAIIIALVSLSILVLWERPFFKKFTFFNTVPGALMVVLVGTALNEWFVYSMPQLALGGEKLVSLPVAGSVSGFLGQFTLPDFSAFSNYQVYVTAITLAIVASLETLLSIEATDKLDPFKRTTPTNQELKAQGLGNMVSGIIGGLPITAVIVRSSANVQAGGKTKLAAIFHGLLLLIGVVFLASVFNRIPLACLAALLLVVGYKLAKISLFKSMYKLGWDQFLPFLVTVVAIQLSDLLKGIAIGMALAVFYILRENYRRAYFYHKGEHHEGEKITLRLAEEVSFLNKGSIAMALAGLPNGTRVVIDGSNSNKIDLDVLEIIHDFKNSSEMRNIKVELKQIPEFKGLTGH